MEGNANATFAATEHETDIDTMCDCFIQSAGRFPEQAGAATYRTCHQDFDLGADKKDAATRRNAATRDGQCDATVIRANRFGIFRVHPGNPGTYTPCTAILTCYPVITNSSSGLLTVWFGP